MNVPSFTPSPFFWNPVTEYLKNQLNKGKSTSLEPKKFDRWKAENEECRKFKKAIKAFETSEDLLRQLEKVEISSSICNLYVFKKGKWKAYFLLKENSLELTGLLITSEEKSLEDTLVLIARAMSRL
ncbi:MAG: hypothetical protein KC643_12665 [Nitrospira sp.]|nr:hypothetical protein [Nitrospira sp.]